MDALEMFPENTLDLGDVRFSYRTCGQQGPQVVLLHGISSGAASWASCAAHLSDSARVLAWDAPGYGSSTPLSQAAPTAADYAQRLSRLLEALQIDSCVLVGHSLGALMAAAYAQEQASRVKAMLLVSPAIGYGERSDAAQVRASRLAGLEQGIAAMAEKLPGRLLSSDATPAQRQQVRDVALQLHAQGYAQAVEMLCAEDLNRYQQLPFLTRVYCGEYDAVTTPAQSLDYAERHDLSFGLIRDAGHACHVEQGAQLAHLVQQMLDHLNGKHQEVQA